MLRVILVILFVSYFLFLGFHAGSIMSKGKISSLDTESLGELFGLDLFISCFVLFFNVIFLKQKKISETIRVFMKVIFMASLMLLTFSTGFHLGTYIVINTHSFIQMVLPISVSFSFLALIFLIIKFILKVDNLKIICISFNNISSLYTKTKRNIKKKE